jgi:hypothetical protein
MKLPNFVSPFWESWSKDGYDFSNEVVQKLKLSINHFYRKCATKQLNYSSTTKKKSDSDDF